MTVNDSDRWSSAHMLTTSLSNSQLSFHFALISLFSPCHFDHVTFWMDLYHTKVPKSLLPILSLNWQSKLFDDDRLTFVATAGHHFFFCGPNFSDKTQDFIYFLSLHNFIHWRCKFWHLFLKFTQLLCKIL